MPLTRTEKLERSLTHSAGKMCFKSSRNLQLSLLHAQQAGITFYTCLKDLTTVPDALSTVNCKLQSYPAAKNQSAKSWNILLSPDANNNPPSPSEILILELGEKRTEGRENSWQDLQLAANQNLVCSKVSFETRRFHMEEGTRRIHRDFVQMARVGRLTRWCWLA